MPDTWQETRAAYLNRLGKPLGLPDIHAGQYLLDAMWRLRPSRNNGWGEVPTDWDQIAPFAAATKAISEPWEFDAIYDMCRAYCEGKADGKNPLSRPPTERG